MLTTVQTKDTVNTGRAIVMKVFTGQFVTRSCVLEVFAFTITNFFQQLTVFIVLGTESVLMELVCVLKGTKAKTVLCKLARTTATAMVTVFIYTPSLSAIAMENMEGTLVM